MNNKDTIYIDIDDEITTIIDKLRASQEKIVALVLPKRASVLQSIVNMKLLKRAADQEGKRAVLITAEAGLLPLAGTVGLYVAKTLQTKPEIPLVSMPVPDDDEIIEEEPLEAEEVTASNAGSRPVGELAGAAATPLAAASDAIETVELDDDLPAIADKADKINDKKAGKSKTKRDKKLGVPNFNRFRLVLILGGVLLVLLIGGAVVAATVLPKATIVVHTDTSSVNSSLALTMDTATKTLNADKLTVPATLQKVDKTGSQQVAASGKKNNGNKASGSVTVTNCDSSDLTIPAGTGFTSSGNTYISQQSVTVPDSNFTSPGSGSKCKNDGKATVNIMAQAGGANYNLDSGASFKVSGYSLVSGSGDSITGGTDNNIQVVAQSDIDNATQKITAQNSDEVKQQLQQQLKQAGLYAVDATFAPGNPKTTSSAQVGDQVSTVTVTQVTTYTMFGVKQADLKTLVDNDVKDKIDSSKQSILSEGLDKANFKLNNITATTASIVLATTATAGPDLQAATVKQQAAGKKAGPVQDALKTNPGVTNVEVKLSPFWVTSVPTNANKVTVIFDKTQ